MTTKNKKRRGTVEEQIEEMRLELLFMGFAVAKETANLRKQTSGTMECPLCQQDLKFSISSCNGHMRAICSTNNCINMME